MNRFGDIDASNKKPPPIYGYRSEQLVSIEKALEPIVPHIDQLLYYIKIAKKHCHFPSEHGLTQDQSAAVYIYTMEWGDTVLYVDTALDKLPTIKEVVWRGVPIDIGKNFTKNQIVTWWSVNSCSSSPNVIKDFLGDNKKSTLFLIEAINGKNVSGYTEYESEDEVILQMGTEFHVKSDPLDQSNGSYVVHLIEIGNNNDQALASNNTNTTDDTTSGQVVAGGKGQGNGLHQLNNPTDVLIDKETDSLIIYDQGNRRILRWSRRSGTTHGEVLIDDIACYALAMDEQKYLYVSDCKNHEVRRYKLGEKSGTLVAGGNGKGDGLNQLNSPRYLFVDRSHNVYVSDNYNHRVMKWSEGAKVGIVVAGGQGEGNALTQLWYPNGLFVDTLDTLYVADSRNDRVMRWAQGDKKQGTVIVGGNDAGAAANQFNRPIDLSFDQNGNLYVADYNNHRVQRFSME
ncbi:unnamed protein product [Rotaria magnacalcarata]|uniref:NAD(P)(+)--arginine ADP-ribosyltransferase n=1 Tax=Rotaria magnacalcarata TaxID=392030 RepID=A0A816Q9I1_9BILA|nr:unnamed protein product [Rotaria magnacalcarata]CAF2056906.1 unnamed protein product [Rotaria magnacalcarata]CAF4234139.1 unnamed protein product [Rotaria magnacalcarata]